MSIRKLEKPLKMMATEAHHYLGDVSRETPTLCEVHSEDGENYIGHWDGEAAFFNVKFPKISTYACS